MLEQLRYARRVVILGCSGSGKTHLTLQLAPLLKLDVIHLDVHFWKPGWQPSTQSEWETRLAELVQRPSWIMDGCFEQSLPLRLPAADLAIVIESSRLACLWRVVKRWLTTDNARRPDAPPGQCVDWSGIRYIWSYPQTCRPYIQRCLSKFGPRNVICLQGSADSRRLIQELRKHLVKEGGDDPFDEVHEAPLDWRMELPQRPVEEMLW